LLALFFVIIPVAGLLSIDLSRASDSGWGDDREDGYYNHRRSPRFCSQIAGMVFLACRNEVADDFLIAIGKCINISDADQREEGKTEARQEWKEGNLQ
jgi:hypothetical protein